MAEVVSGVAASKTAGAGGGRCVRGSVVTPASASCSLSRVLKDRRKLEPRGSD